MIIGITGTDGAGKGTVVDYLVEHKGFVHYSARQLYIEEIHKRGLPVDREHMRLMGNDLRRLHGDDFLISHYTAKAHAEGVSHALIESIRASAEADALKAQGGILLAVDADQLLRYERIIARASASDHVTFEGFKAHEELEMHDTDPHGMQKAAVIAAADHTILNNGTIEELQAQIDAVLRQLQKV